MAKEETNISTRIQLNVTDNVTLFRNNVGQANVGTEEYPRIIRYGVCNPGGSDLLGFTETVITPEMMGKKVAIFTAIEVKTAKGKPSKAQQNFINIVAAAGGIAGVARSPEDANELIAPASSSSPPKSI